MGRWLVVLTVLTSSAFGASAASATIIGLNEGGSSDWVAVGHSGASLFRATFSWRLVTQQGNWREDAAWEKSLDPEVEGAAKNGYSILGLLAGRDEEPVHEFYLRTDPKWAEYQEFVAKAVDRYGQNGSFWNSHPGLPYRPIKVWEVWNEPNTDLYSPNGGGKGVLPQKYAEFLIETSRTIRTKSLCCRTGESWETAVLHGGLYQGNSSEEVVSVSEFVKKESLITGWSASFDGFGIHPYSLSGTESEKLAKFKTHVKEARTALEPVANKPIWVTEVGWPVESGSTEYEQQALLTSSFNWVKKNEYNVAEITWYNYQDFGESSWAERAGLRRRDGTFRPSWTAFQAEAGVSSTWPGAVMAFQANSSILITNFSLSGGEFTGQGMAGGTSPSVARLSTSGYQTAFQANNGSLYTWGAAGNANLGQGMMAGTSPSISGLVTGGYEIAFQANTGSLITFGHENRNWGLGMAIGTSPGITALTGSGYEAAFQANTTQLWTAGTAGTQNWGLGMAGGTSPSITWLSSGGYEVAFEANTAQLWVAGSAGSFSTGLGMAAGTSPSIVGFPSGGYEIAFQANSGELWTYGTAGTTDWHQPMATGTNPSITTLSNGSYQVAYQTNSGQLATIGPEIGANTGQGMASGTSPDTAPN